MTANQAALLRPRVPIFAFTPDSKVCSRLTLSRGVRSFEIKFEETPRETIASAVRQLRQARDIESGTPLVMVSDILQEGKAVDSIIVEHA